MRTVVTVKGLKRVLEGWPEERMDGTPIEVWIETGYELSSPVTQIETLYSRGGRADLMLSSDAFTRAPQSPTMT